MVERVIMSVYDAQGDLNNALYNNDLLLGTRQMITPWNYELVVIENKIQVLPSRTIVPNGSLTDLTPPSIVDSPLLWPAVIEAYGVIRPGISQIRLIQPDETEVVGTIVIDPNDDRFLLYNVDIDTTPQNTLDPIDAVINPLISGPGDGLDSAVEGQRYLLTEDTGAMDNQYPAVEWVGGNGRPLVAQANDIIEYVAPNRWRVVFAAATETDIQYVTNITTGIQYEWSGAEWIKSYQGVYPGGTWSLVL
mgnify:CR=1 FL=1